MKASRSIVGIILALMMLSSASAAVAANYFAVNSDALSYVKARGWMSGYSNGSFGEGNTVNRAEFSKVITLIYSSTVPPIYTTLLPFRDTVNNAWYTPYIVYVYGNGLLTGYPDNTFHPDSPISFAEAAKVLAIVYHLKVTTNGSNWYEGSVRALANEKAIPTSITSFDAYLTRGQLADMVYRLDSGNRNQPSQTYDDIARTGGSINTSDCGNNKSVQVTIDPQDTTPSVGGSLIYGIHVRNCTDRDEQVDVSAILDSQVSYDYSSDGGFVNGRRTVNWNNVDVQSGDEHTLTLHVRLQNYITNHDRIDLTVRATGLNSDTDSATNTVYVSGSNTGANNCYTDSYGQYTCNNNNCNNSQNSNNCYYDSNNNYICNNNNNNNCNNTSGNGYCYYDSVGRYICKYLNDSGNCYYDSNNNYICNNGNNSNNCYYNSNNQYICNNSNNNNNNCYYDSNNNYICNSNNNCGNNCYYDSNGRYICSDASSGNCNNGNNSNNCYYDSNNNYICNNYGTNNLTIIPDSTQPQPDDVVRYTVRLRNTTGSSRAFTIRAQFSPDLTFVSGSNSVQVTDNRSVYWNYVYIDAYQTEELTLKLKVRTGASDGERLDVNVSAADNNGGQAVSQIATVNVLNYHRNNSGNCYYDSYGRYVCNNTDSCYYNSYGQYTCNNGGNVSLSLRTDSSNARSGDVVRTYITLTNNQNRDDYIDLQANLDPNLTYTSASNSPDSSRNGFIEWNRLFLRANRTSTITLETRIASYARIGSQLRINVTAAGSTNTAADSAYINVRS